MSAIVTIEGVYRDRLIDAGGCTLSDSGWRKNMVVLPCRVLLAAFMKNEPTALGVRSLQIGRGDPAWDNSPPPNPDPNTTTKLTDAAPFVVPLANLTIQFLDATDNVVATSTNRIQITAKLGPGQPTPATFPLREFGVFGQLNGAPQMIDYVRHPVIQKAGPQTLERKVRLAF